MQVFEYLARSEHLPDYATDFVWVKQTSNGEPSLGTEYRYRMKRGTEGTFARTGVASGLVQTSFQVGGAIVLAIVTAIVSSHGGGSATHVVNGYRTALEVITGVSAAGLLVVLGALATQRRGVPAAAAARS